MIIPKSLTLSLFLLSLSWARAKGIKQNEEKQNILEVCGGTIESDSDTITFQKSPLTPGEICVWTVHLQTRMAFGLNFSYFDIQSSAPNCANGGVRIYALNNLINPEDSHSYTFCNNQPPPPGDFFLGYTIAVVILYSAEGNSNPGSGFELNWSGSSLDPMRTNHVSSYSTASEGIIKYPVVGNYQPNVAATWLIKPMITQVPTRVNLMIDSISLESCTMPGDNCACDSVILYEVNVTGHLKESKKLCGEEDSITLAGLEYRFIIAFFSDYQDQAGGSGFAAMYYPGEEGTTMPSSATTMPTTTPEPTTKPTTEPPETTRRPTTLPPTETTETTMESTTEPLSTTRRPTTLPPTETTETTMEPTTLPLETDTTTEFPPVTECGKIIELSGRHIIAYKTHENYVTNERCTWIIRNNLGTTMHFDLLASALHSNDRVIITTFQRLSTESYRPALTSRVLTPSSRHYDIPGRIAVVTFASSSSFTGGKGFELEIFLNSGSPPNNVTTLSRDFSSDGYDFGNVRHPTSGQYRNHELSMFLVNQPNFRWQHSWTEYEIHALGIENGFDEMAAYTFNFPEGWVRNWISKDWPVGRKRYTNHNDMTLFVFSTDTATTGSGFNLTWYPGIEDSTTWSNFI